VSYALHHVMKATAGLSDEEAAGNLFVMDTKGVLPIRRAVGDKKPLRFVAKDLENPSTCCGVTPSDNLLEVIRKVKPAGVIGLTGAPGTFSEDVVRLLSEINPYPIVFPLSNPTSRAECTFQQALEWSAGNCIFASGSPFEPVEYNGVMRYSNQANNMYVFPGIGLGAILADSPVLTDEMFAAAAHALANTVTTESLLKTQQLFPGVSKARNGSAPIARAIVEIANRERGCEEATPSVEEIRKRMYEPAYGPVEGKGEN